MAYIDGYIKQQYNYSNCINYSCCIYSLRIIYSFRIMFEVTILFISYNKGVKIFESYIVFVLNIYDSNILFVSYNIRSEYSIRFVQYSH